jgi:lysyl endopeptidase
MKNIILIAVSALISVSSWAQTTDSRGPYEWPMDRSQGEKITLPAIDTEKMLREDAENERLKIGPWRFGKNFEVDYTLSNSGTWTTLNNDDRLWQISIEGTKALSLNFIFNNYHLPAGAELYIYSPTTKQHIGAYTSLNNSVSNVLGSDLLHGNEAIIQLYLPADIDFEPSLSIKTITHGYKAIGAYAQHLARGLNDSGDCNIDVNCPLGDGWEKQIRAVAMIVVNGNGACTGTLINNTKSDGTPYFLTANHCGTSVSNWAFRFNWESPTPSCATATGSAPDNEYDTMNGAVLIANNDNSDVSLVKFNNDIPLSYNVYYAGWDKSDMASGPSTGIHHPSGDIKKICRDEETVQPISIDFNNNSVTKMWKINDWDQGVTEPGSSGSALFDSKGKIIGQLAGGQAACAGTTDNNLEDYYGRFGVSWDFGATPETRLKDWLDPLNLNLDTLDGFDPNQAQYANDIRLSSILGITQTTCEATITGDFNPIVKMNNQGSDTIQDFILYHRLDNNDVDSIILINQNWASLTPLEVPLPAFAKTSGEHTLLVYSSLPNGIQDKNQKNDTLKISFNVDEGNLFTFNLALDYYPEETSWYLQSVDNVIIDSGDNYTSQQVISNNYCLQEDCYKIDVYDSGNNGLTGFFNFFAQGTFSGLTTNGDTIFNLDPDSLDFGAQYSRSFCIPYTVGIEERIFGKNTYIYPNPNQGTFVVSTSTESLKKVQLFSSTGALIQEFETNKRLISIDIKDKPNGIYLVSIKLNGINSTYKVYKTY